MELKKLSYVNTENGYFDSLTASTQEIVKDAILKAAQGRNGPEGYKTDDECLEDVECRSRDGFMPFSHNRGGLLYRNFTDLMEYWGGGHIVAHAKADCEIQRQIDYSLNSIKADIYQDNESLCLELNINEDDCNYNSLSEFEHKSELLTQEQRDKIKKMMSDIQDMESERLSGNEASVMHEFRFMYHGVNDKGIHEASVSAAINTESPYHRSSISWAPNVFCEGAKEVEIKWRTNAELKRKLDKAFKQVSKAIF